MTWLAIAVAGGLGALVRSRLADALRERAHGAVTATATVNLAGAFALGLVVGGSASTTVVAVVGTGLLGGLTTFSTWLTQASALESVAGRAVVVVGQAAAGVLLAAAGLALGSA